MAPLQEKSGRDDGCYDFVGDVQCTRPGFLKQKKIYIKKKISQILKYLDKNFDFLVYIYAT